MCSFVPLSRSEGFGGSWYNYCTLDSCHPIRYGWKSYGCVLNTPIHVPYGCYGGCGGGCYGCYGGWNRGYGCYGAGCYGYGIGYWHDAASYGAGYHGFGAYGNFGNGVTAYGVNNGVEGHSSSSAAVAWSTSLAHSGRNLRKSL